MSHASADKSHALLAELLAELANILRCFDRDDMQGRRIAGGAVLTTLERKTMDRIRELIAKGGGQ